MFVFFALRHPARWLVANQSGAKLQFSLNIQARFKVFYAKMSEFKLYRLSRNTRCCMFFMFYSTFLAIMNPDEAFFRIFLLNFAPNIFKIL